MIWMRGQAIAVRVAISCGTLNVIDRQAKPVKALDVCLWATLMSSNTSLNKFYWISVNGVSPSIDMTTYSPSGAPSSVMTISSISSLLFVLGCSARHVGLLIACITLAVPPGLLCP